MKTKTKIRKVKNVWTEKYKTLNKMEIPEDIKKKLRAEARKWLDFIRAERGEIVFGDEGEQDGHYQYHSGEINFIEFFFNLDDKEKKHA